MARPSLQRIYKNILLVTPNPIALGIQALIALLRVVPGLDKFCDEASARVTRSMDDREANIRADIEKIINRENEASVMKAERRAKKAASNAKAEEDLQKHKEEEARHKAAKEVTNKRTNLNKEGIKDDTKHKILEEEDLRKKNLLLLKQEHKHRLEQNEILHSTAWINNTRIHLDTMTDHINKLAETAKNTSGSAEKNTAATNKATKEIEGLRSGMALVIDATAKLTSELHKYDTQRIKGNLEKDHAEKIQKTMLDIMTAESKLNTKIEISSLDGKAALQQTITKDLAAKDKNIDALLGKQSIETIEKIHQLTKTQLESQHKIIQLITEPSQRDECEKHLNHLNSLLDRTGGIMSQLEGKNPSWESNDILALNEPSRGLEERTENVGVSFKVCK
jgi:hypothetical protein